MWADILKKNKFSIILLGLGVVLLLIGVSMLIPFTFSKSSGIEIIEGENTNVVVEIAGSVVKPGVYEIENGRVGDLIDLAGGISKEANHDWVAKNINRASRLTDGQKIYIPSQQSDNVTASKVSGYQTISGEENAVGGSSININTASLQELESLPGIGPVYAQNIVDQRPYSNKEELISKGALKKNVYDKIKDAIGVF